jgi:hypothetical protein
MKTLLTSKHYQIFLLFFVPAFFIQQSPMREIAFLVTSATFLAWVYAIATEGQRHITALGLLPMNHRLFQTNILLLGVMMLLRTGITLFAPGWMETYPRFTVIVSVLSCYCLWQTTLYAGKALAKAEWGREVTLGEYFPNFLQIIFLLFGIWFIQPRINRVFGDNLE